MVQLHQLRFSVLHDIDPDNPGLGGKLTYVIDAVCIPVNELIEFESTWTKVPE